MLEIGNGALTLAEQRSHFALWALQKSPLIIGSDVRALPTESLSILQNKYLIQVNQDDLGIQGTLRASMNYAYGGTGTEKLSPKPRHSVDEVQAAAQDATLDPPNGTSVWIAHCSFGASSASIVAAQQWKISADRKTLMQQAAKGSTDASDKCLARSANEKTVVVTPCNGGDDSGLTEWAFGNVDTTISQVRDPADASSCLAFNGTSLHMEACRTETSDQQKPADCARSRCRFSSLIYQQWYLNSLQQMASAFTNIHNG
jgi:hypothetical protein